MLVNKRKVGQLGVMKVNNFDNDFAFEKTQSVRFNRLYKHLFPDLITIETVGLDREKQGIDKIIKFFDKEITTQEKARREDYGDFLIEMWHYTPYGRQKGWVAKTEADLLFYAVPDKIYALPLPALQEWLQNHKEYLKSLKWVKAYNSNGNYWTWSKPVEWVKFGFVIAYDF